MKTLSLAFVVFLFLLSGCTKGPKPVAAFTMDKNEALARDTVTFTNQSTDATSYSWDFGDDSVSVAENPVHAFWKNGTYTVTLTATGDGGSNSTSQDITILPSLTGKWSSTFTLFTDYHGTLILVQDESGNITGSMELMTGIGTEPLASTSKITGTAVVIEAIVEGSSYAFKGTVNADYDYITGSFFYDGQHFGNWYAIKK